MSLSSEQRTTAETEALRELAAFPLLEALYGRRSRRFALGGEIPDGPLAYQSKHEPLPLTELERMLVLSAMGGTTGWHYSITRHARYAPHVSNYAAGAAGRTFPSAAGFHTAELFFTDDSGLYFFPTRDAGALVDPATDGVTPELMVERHRERLRKLSDGRLYLPRGGALPGGAQHLVRQRPGLAARHPGRGHRPAPDRDPLLLRPERVRDLRRRQRPQDPGARGVRRAGRRRGALPAHLHRAVRADRGHRGARHRLLRRRADAPGDGPRRLDVRRDRPLLDARRLRQPRRARPRLPLRRGRALVDAQPHRARGRVRGLLPAALPRHGGGGRGLRRAQVRPRRAVQPRHSRRLERQPRRPRKRPGPRRASSRPASRFRRSTSSTPSAGSPARCRRCSS